MDGFGEFKTKKWFVYLGDHHEGPFSLEEIQTKIAGGQLTATNYIWADGMPDWKMMSEVPAFDEVIKNGQAAIAPPPPPANTPPSEPSIAPATEQSIFAPSNATSLAPDLATASAVSLEASPALEAAPAFEVAPALEATPVFEATPVLEAAPALDSGPALMASPVAEVAPAFEPTVGLTPSLGLDPTPSAQPTAPEAPPVIATNPGFTLPVAETALNSAGHSIHLEAAVSNRNFGKPVDDRRSHTTAQPQPQPQRRSLMKWVGIAAILGGIGVAYSGGYFSPLTNTPAAKAGIQSVGSILDPVLNTIGDKVPIIGQWISPIPPLEDVTREEYEQLKTAAKGNLDGTGPRIAVALSQADMFSPTLYLATNLPDGATFGVYVDGIPETLLNQLSYAAVAQATVSKHLAKITNLKSGDNKPFPRGKYTVYILLPDTQIPSVKPYSMRLPAINAEGLSFTLPPNSRIVTTRSYFLGGPRDATYTTRLKEFHDKITARAQAELNECNQFSNLLEQQLVGTNSKFTGLKKGRRVSAGQKKSWENFHKSWSTLAEQISQAFAKMTPETLKNDYFYGSLYLASQQASVAVGHLHDIQNSYFTSSADPRSFDIQLGEAGSVAQAALNELKAKIDRIEKLPPNPNGMPVRDNL